ncbi:MAG: methyltransferase domain-containing protein [Candidatus Omnitrophota bacterium]|jgi:predicted SAM-dependent methyltransferase
MKILNPKASFDGRYLLNIGCGGRFHIEWNNIDFKPAHPHIIKLDIKKGLPYETKSFDAVYSSHLMEHLNAEAARNLLSESSRVLKPNGILRLVMPDLEYNAKLYLESLNRVKLDKSPLNREHYEWAVLNLIDQFVREKSGGAMKKFLLRQDLQDDDFIVSTTGGGEVQIVRDTGKIPGQQNSLLRICRGLKNRFISRNFQKSGEKHNWAYDSYSAGKLLQDSGFSDVQILDPYSSSIPKFNSFNLDVDINGIVYKPNSLFVECRK